MLIQKDKHTLPKKEFWDRQEWTKEMLTSEAILFPTLPPRLGSGYLQKKKKTIKRKMTCLYPPCGYRMQLLHGCIYIHCYSPLIQDLKCSGSKTFAKQSSTKTLSGQQLSQSPLHKGDTTFLGTHSRLSPAIQCRFLCCLS